MHHTFDAKNGQLTLLTYKDKTDQYPIRRSVQTIDKNTSFYKTYRNDCIKNIQDGYINSVDAKKEFKSFYFEECMNMIKTDKDSVIRYWEKQLIDNLLDDIRVADNILIRSKVEY